MRVEPLSGNAYRWGQGATTNTIGSGVANITYCSPVAVSDCDQLQILALVSTATSGISAVLQLQWSADGSNWANESVESLGALTGTEQRYTLYTKAWGPLAASSTLYSIPRPVTAHFVRVGCYGTGVPNAADYVAITIERQRSGQLQQSGS